MKNLLKTMAAGVVLTLAACENEEAPAGGTNDVSRLAQIALETKYPGASNVRWLTKGDYVVAVFSMPATRAVPDTENDLAAWFDNGGVWYMTETDIPFTSLPDAVRQAFNGSEYANAPWEMDDVDKLERDGVETIYVIEVEKKENGRETEVDLYYADNGVLVKQVTDSGNDYDYSDYIPSKPSGNIEQYIRDNYPGARITDIDRERDMTEVEIIDGQVRRELLFAGNGVWKYTKTEIKDKNTIPQAVAAALQASDYVTYRIDDIDHYKTPDSEFYRYDLESRYGDVKVDITPEGTLTLVQAGGNPGQGNGQMVNVEISSFIHQKYPGARIVEYDYDDGLLEVEIFHEYLEKEVYFNGRNQWVYTEWDIRPNALPQAVKDAIAASQWATFEIDDMEYVQTPQQEYYLIELESGNREVELRVKADGTIF
ncbi:PepSY-like domain-containing protein [Bacteroides caecimuris]|uniref:PepSY-like domain-containing protein n=1 Tax=Bacteroides caecimuris TaxID=1796613 RepID=UPI001C3E07AC|nr:PepSY-like domain-containing protein [Bacteroides caecimuris]